MTGEREETLFGGLEESRVFRVGAKVHRPAGAWTPTIHALLRHLEAKGFPAPRALGYDDQGREIVGFIEGRASNWPWPPALLEPRGVRQVGALLAAYHAAVAGFTPPRPALWRHGPGEPAPGEIVLHGDFGPYNLIWRGEKLFGVINWDLARPGRPIEEAAFAAFKCAPLQGEDAVAPLGFAAPPDRRTRLEAFAEAYGAFSAGELVAVAIEVCAADIGRMQDLGHRGVEPWCAWLRRGLLERTRADIDWLRAWTRGEGLI